MSTIDFSDGVKMKLEDFSDEFKQFVDVAFYGGAGEEELENVILKVTDLKGTLKYLPLYDWDGGDSIMTECMNCDWEKSWFVFGGPGVGEFKVIDPSKPAYVFYQYACSEEITVIKL